MISKLNLIASRLSLLMLMVPLSGCVFDNLAETIKAGLRAPGKGTVVVCPPPLPNPPGAVWDALDAARRKDELAGGWIIALQKHYESQDACAEATARN